MVHLQASIVHLSVPTVTSMLTVLSSFHVQQSWTQCRSMSKHGTLVGHMTSLVQGSQLFGGLPDSESSCQFRMLATVHIQVVNDLWQPQPWPHYRCQQCEWGYGGSHAVQRVIRAVAYDYQLLHGCIGPVYGHSVIAVCWVSPSHPWGQLSCLPCRTPEGGPWTGNWIVMSCCCQPSENSASFLVRRLPQTHVSLHPFRAWLFCAFQGIILVRIPNEVRTWHTAQLRRNIWDEYLLGIFIKCLGSCWIHHLNDDSTTKNYAGSIRGLILRWRLVLQACQNVTLGTTS